MTIISRINRACGAFLEEFKCILKDEGALLFCIILPLAYPVIYSWIYNNEVVRDVPVAIVDMSHSAMSREFVQKYDASPDVMVALYCNSIDEAREAVGRGEVYGILYFPEDFEKKVMRHEQAHVSVYCDMSYMLTYKAIFQTATAVSGVMGSEIQAEMAEHSTAREAEIASKPLEYEEVPMFNVTAGYGNFVLPVVLTIIIQQAMLLAVGLICGTDRERQFASVRSVVSTLLGKSAAYILVFGLMLAYVTMAVPRMFGFVMMMHFSDWILFMTPYLLACVFFAFTVSELVRYRENVMLVVVFTSLPMLFLTGMSWPLSNVPGFWQSVGALIPSTFCVRGYIRLSSMGATLSDVAPELRALWLQVIGYGLVALYVTHRRYKWRINHS